MKKTFTFELPIWLQKMNLNDDIEFSDKEKMELAILLSRKNIEESTGGPFGAAIFDINTHRLLSVGVNIVVPSNWSCGHAEMVAFSIAHATAKTYDLSLKADYALYSSAEPCVMCLGGTIWSGVKQLVCAARHEDIQNIGFDEGPKPQKWAEELENRGITVIKDFLRKKAVEVLKQYATSDGKIYNAKH
jgi:tRNA(Arg) A34 adenosine deaminase TadA